MLKEHTLKYFDSAEVENEVAELPSCWSYYFTNHFLPKGIAVLDCSDGNLEYFENLAISGDECTQGDVKWIKSFRALGHRGEIRIWLS